MNRLRSFLELPGWEQRLFVEALGLLVVVQIGLQLSSFQTVRTVLDQLTDIVPAAKHEPSSDTVVWAVDAASALIPYTSTCLARAVVTETMLARRGQQSSLRIGVAQESPEQLTAHSWLICDGEIIIGDDVDLTEYAEFPSFDGL